MAMSSSCCSCCAPNSFMRLGAFIVGSQRIEGAMSFSSFAYSSCKVFLNIQGKTEKGRTRPATPVPALNNLLHLGIIVHEIEHPSIQIKSRRHIKHGELVLAPGGRVQRCSIHQNGPFHWQSLMNWSIDFP